MFHQEQTLLQQDVHTGGGRPGPLADQESGVFFRPEKVGISKCPLNIVGVPLVVRPTTVEGVEGEGERWRSVRQPSRCSSRLYFDLREEGKEDEMKNDI